MNVRSLRFFLVAASAFSVPVAAGAAVLNVNGSGQLTGATGVKIDGAFYDVMFADGSCNSLFSNCDASTFTFQNVTAAGDAAQALLDQVFLDGAKGNFDSHPELTVGCTATDVCTALIPFSEDSAGVMAAGAVNRSPPGVDQVDLAILSPADDLGQQSHGTFALFTRSTALPEPGTWAMMLLGFAAVALALRKVRTREHHGMGALA